MQKKFGLVAVLAVGLLVAPANAALDFEVDPGAGWLSYVNMFDLGGGYLFGFGWGPDIFKNPATFDPGTLTLEANTQLWDEQATNPDWFDQTTGDATRIGEFNTYYEVASLVGEDVTFSGDVLSNTMAGHQVEAFIKVLDPGAGWATTQEVYEPLVTGQPFDLSLTVAGSPGVITQFGFFVKGAYVSPADQAGEGSVVIGAIPEPATLALLALGGLAVLRRR